MDNTKLIKKLTKICFISFLACIVVNAQAGILQWSDDMEYADQPAFEAEWPMGFVGIGGTPLELTTEISRSGSKSVKCNVDKQVSTHLFPEQLPTGAIEVWMYDSFTVTEPNSAWVWVEAGMHNGNWSMVGVLSKQLGDNYVYRYADGDYHDSGIPRSQGWHRIVLTFGDPEVGSSIFLDGIHLADNAVIMSDGCKRVRIGVDWDGQNNAEAFYFDDISYNFDMNPLTDDPNTLALWHMDGTIIIDANTYVSDDDSNNPGRNNDLGLGLISGTTPPSLTTGNGGIWGEALQFNGSSDMAVVPGNKWLGDSNGLETVNVDFWLRPTSLLPTGTIVGVPGVWEVELDGRVFLTVWDSNAAADPNGVPPTRLMGAGTVPNVWHHVIATYESGKMTVIVNGEKATGTGPLWNRADTVITVGNRLGASTYFRGLIDELKISFPTLKCGDWGYPAADLNKDCYVTLEDFSLMAGEWGACTDPNDSVNCTIVAP